jgi:hypothetical protein
MKLKLKELIFPALIILIAASMRLLPHLPNFTPISAMALFGGTYINKKYSIIITLLAMFVSDIFLGFHSTMPYVYGSFVLTVFIGSWVKDHKTFKNILSASLASSILFFLITNFGVWVNGWYPRNISGLIQCYTLAIPFFKHTLTGDLFYVGLFFGSFEFLSYFLINPFVKKVSAKNE